MLLSTVSTRSWKDVLDSLVATGCRLLDQGAGSPRDNADDVELAADEACVPLLSRDVDDGASS